MYSNDTNSSLLGLRSALFHFLIGVHTVAWVGVYLEFEHQTATVTFPLVVEDTKTVMIMSQRNTNMYIV